MNAKWQRPKVVRIIKGIFEMNKTADVRDDGNETHSSTPMTVFLSSARYKILNHAEKGRL
jgi:hypothetical protein